MRRITADEIKAYREEHGCSMPEAKRVLSDRAKSEYIAELERDRDYWRTCFLEQAGDTLTVDHERSELKQRIAELEQLNAEYMDINHEQGMTIIEQGKRIEQLESLVRDMWRTLSAMYGLNLGIDIGKERDYEQRMSALGLLGGDA